MYDEAIKINPKYVNAFYNRGLCLYILSIANSLY